MKKEVGEVKALFVSIKGEENRVAKEIITLDENGVVEDKFYGKNIQRSVLIASQVSYDLAKENDIDVEYGKLGENILMDYNLYHLEVGTKIQIGDALLEITMPCTLCNGLSKVNNKLPKLLKSDRGIFTRTIKEAQVKKGDKVYLLD